MVSTPRIGNSLGDRDSIDASASDTADDRLGTAPLTPPHPACRSPLWAGAPGVRSRGFGGSLLAARRTPHRRCAVHANHFPPPCGARGRDTLVVGLHHFAALRTRSRPASVSASRRSPAVCIAGEATRRSLRHLHGHLSSGEGTIRREVDPWACLFCVLPHRREVVWLMTFVSQVGVHGCIGTVHRAIIVSMFRCAEIRSGRRRGVHWRTPYHWLTEAPYRANPSCPPSIVVGRRRPGMDPVQQGAYHTGMRHTGIAQIGPTYRYAIVPGQMWPMYTGTIHTGTSRTGLNGRG